MLGHDAAPTAFWKENLVNGAKLERCPVRTLQLAEPALAAEVTRHVADYYPFYEDGYLLVAGGIAEQPARFIDYMQEISRLRSVVDRKYEKLKTEEQ